MKKGIKIILVIFGVIAGIAISPLFSTVLFLWADKSLLGLLFLNLFILGVIFVPIALLLSPIYFAYKNKQREERRNSLN